MRTTALKSVLAVLAFLLPFLALGQQQINIATQVKGLGSNVANFLGTPSSANLMSAVTNETGTGSLVFSDAPTLQGLYTTGSINLISSNLRISGEFTSATVLARTLFQTSVGFSDSDVGVIPTRANGIAGFSAYSSNNPGTSSSAVSLYTDNNSGQTRVGINSFATGSGTTKPIWFHFNGAAPTSTSGGMVTTTGFQGAIGQTTPAKGKFTQVDSVTMLVSSTTPTIGSGFGTSPSIVASNGTAAFTLNIGSGGSATSGVVIMPVANTGWACTAMPNTVPQAGAVMYSSPTSTSSITITNYTQATGVALAWPTNTIISVKCVGY